MSAARHKRSPDTDHDRAEPAAAPPGHDAQDDPREAASGTDAGANPGANPGAPRSDAERIRQLEQQLAEAQAERLRLIAEYQTSQRRALESETRARGAGVAAAARHVIPVIDNLDLALGRTEGMSVESAIEGLTMLRAELCKALEKSGIEKIDPQPGDEFDPHRHEAVMRHAGDGVAPGRISMILQPGYRLGDVVLRAAKVAVAPEPE